MGASPVPRGLVHHCSNVILPLVECSCPRACRHLSGAAPLPRTVVVEGHMMLVGKGEGEEGVGKQEGGGREEETEGVGKAEGM